MIIKNSDDKRNLKCLAFNFMLPTGYQFLNMAMKCDEFFCFVFFLCYCYTDIFVEFGASQFNEINFERVVLKPTLPYAI